MKLHLHRSRKVRRRLTRWLSRTVGVALAGSLLLAGPALYAHEGHDHTPGSQAPASQDLAWVIQQGPSLSASQKQELLKNLEPKLEDEQAIADLSPDELVDLVRAWRVLGAPRQQRVQLWVLWHQQSQGWKQAQAGELARLIEELRKLQHSKEADQVQADLTAHAWDTFLQDDEHLQPDQDQDLQGVLNLAGLVGPRQVPTLKYQLLDRLHQHLVEDQDRLAQLSVPQVLALEEAVRRLDRDHTGRKAASVVLAWTATNAYQQVQEPAHLAQLINFLSRHKHNEEFEQAMTQVAQHGWESQLKNQEQLDQGQLELAQALAPWLEQAQRQSLASKLQSTQLPSLSYQQLRDLWQLTIDLGLSQQDQRQLLAAWISQEPADQPSPEVLAGQARLLESAHRLLEGQELAQAQEQLYQRILDLFQDQDYLAKHDRQQIFVLARTLTQQGSQSQRQQLRQTLEQAWVGNDQFLGSLSYRHLADLTTVLGVLGASEQDQALVTAKWLDASDAWKTYDAWRLAQLLGMLQAGEDQDQQARQTLIAHAKDHLQNPDLVERSKDVAQLLDAVQEQLSQDEKDQIRQALHQRLAQEDLERLNWGPSELGIWGQVLARLYPASSDSADRPIPFEQAGKILVEHEPSSTVVAMALVQYYHAAGDPDRSPVGFNTYAQSQAVDPEVPADHQAAYYIVQAHQMEMASPEQAILSGLTLGEQALGVAESEPVRASVLKWIVSRRLRAEHFHPSRNLLQSVQGQFQTQGAQDQIAYLLEVIDEQEAKAVTRDKYFEQRMEVARLKGQLESLERRLAEAREKGKDQEAAGLQKIIDATTTRLRELE